MKSTNISSLLLPLLASISLKMPSAWNHQSMSSLLLTNPVMEKLWLTGTTHLHASSFLYISNHSLLLERLLRGHRAYHDIHLPHGLDHALVIIQRPRNDIEAFSPLTRCTGRAHLLEPWRTERNTGSAHLPGEAWRRRRWGARWCGRTSPKVGWPAARLARARRPVAPTSRNLLLGASSGIARPADEIATVVLSMKWW
jgi:hypothetical protein